MEAFMLVILKEEKLMVREPISSEMDHITREILLITKRKVHQDFIVPTLLDIPVALSKIFFMDKEKSLDSVMNTTESIILALKLKENWNGLMKVGSIIMKDLSTKKVNFKTKVHIL